MPFHDETVPVAANVPGLEAYRDRWRRLARQCQGCRACATKPRGQRMTAAPMSAIGMSKSFVSVKALRMSAASTCAGRGACAAR